MGLLDEVMNNNEVRKSVQNIYGFISKHNEDVNKIFDLVYNDLRNIFKEVEIINGKMVVVLKDSTDIHKSLQIVKGAIVKHTNDQLPNITFDVLTIHSASNKIYIKKRQNEVVPE